MPVASPLAWIAVALLAPAAVGAGPNVPPRDPDHAVHAVTPVAAAPVAAAPAAATGTNAVVGAAFTYQGLLKFNGSLAQGAYDFVFALYADSTGATQVGATQTALGVQVTNGFFAVPVDFGAAAYDGNARWLDIQVRPAGGGAYSPQSPRVPLRAAPYATRAINGPAGASQWANDTYGIDYASKVGIGTATNPYAKTWIENGSAANQALYVTSSNGPWAAFVLRNYGTNGWGLYDDTSRFHYLYGDLGVGQPNPGYPVDIQNTVGGGMRIASTGFSQSAGYPGEGVRAALFVHGYTGTGALGASSGGIYASSADSRAVSGWSNTGWGIDGNCTGSGCYGVLGTPNEGVFGFTPNLAQPAAHFSAPSGGTAIVADGLTRTKTLQIVGGSDLAEPFDVAHAAGASPDPGSVVVIDPAHPGDLAVSADAYDTRVAGVISGANDLAPGMVMESDHPHAHGDHPVALTGRVWCKVDAGYGAVHPGDLLVTSPTPGHAMRAGDAARRAGAVLGKAMTSLEAGRGLVLVLVSLQ